MAILSNLRTDPRKEREGVWVTIEGIRFKVALYQRGLDQEVEALAPEVRRRIREGRATATELLELVFRTTADRVILDWQDLQDYERGPDGAVLFDEDGTAKVVDVAYSREKARAIVEDPELRPILDELLTIAQDRAKFRRDVLEDARGN